MLAIIARCAKEAARTHVLEQAVRGVATKAAAKPASADIKLPTAPLQLSGTSANIATLTWQVAAKENVIDKVQDELQQVATIISDTPELRRLATDPFVPALVRKKLISNLFKDSGAHKITVNLLDALADENALAAVPSVSSAYDELVLAHKKEVYCTIVTAHPLDRMERDEVRKAAEKFVEPGFKLVAKEKVDKKLVGGFILEFEDRLVDLSTAKKVSEFNQQVQKLENDLK
uniref:ATP synthase subunit O, mitochondrial n=1 Tax=Chlamydomonas leiostraca TaxID=1034604 RepID=A0A7S0R719_9CHLO|mmetsp:Transcript_1539/g.4112  ORF Transcript_1539/g.4112 Transcript_1539/m.4112 type:complete len:232 (+) Transcript_1539:69-764(+)|eukprot:CAMPEP_0202857296 /NCGR_PEP_ID=MMETSP1391-20130828/296_1 /ASSEMBLY_ACC=CAM_ASM_000867 /TAXON_ID=1034604 /ORGANISM="Chlamydomonas leiostraca, Strain SAG 11-49" /LENGTH=231 /DNA_ID=CAMNT_0049536081 /DNA_START=70 /DNA_END=765 /DNA_ORIENTATION=-